MFFKKTKDNGTAGNGAADTQPKASGGAAVPPKSAGVNAPTPAPAAPLPASTPATTLPPETAAGGAKAASPLDTLRALGEVVSVLTRTKSFQNMTLAELAEVARPAIASGQIAIASAENKAHTARLPVAVLLWAQVSDDVDKRLQETLDGPVRLTAAERSSGDNPWIMISAGDPRALNSLVSEVSTKRFAGRPMRVRVRQADGSFKIQS